MRARSHPLGVSRCGRRFPTLLAFFLVAAVGTSAARSGVSCQGVKLTQYRSFASFVHAHRAGAVALTDSGRLIPLQSQSVCKVSPPGDALIFTVSTANPSPEPLASYIAVESLRVFKYDPNYSQVGVGRNARWWRGGAEVPALASMPIASSVDDFVALHRSSAAAPPQPLSQWHANVDRGGPSSWLNRDLLLALSSKWRETLDARRLLMNQQRFAQGGYLLLRFREARVPSVRGRLTFSVRHRGAQLILVRIYSPLPAYNESFYIRFG